MLLKYLTWRLKTLFGYFYQIKNVLSENCVSLWTERKYCLPRCQLYHFEQSICFETRY